MNGAVVVGSHNAAIGMAAAVEILTGGGSALDAVEAAVRLVEDNADDHTVGYSGYPNLVGQVELDASIIDGTTRRAGAVGSLRGYRHAITVARAVMERLPHVLIVGDGAARLADELGMEAEDLLTPEAQRVWEEGVEARLASDPEHVAGTVNVISRDQAGRLASTVSTSGWAWKYPGRLGDSPIVGAGNYADDRYGAAACTGWGELAIRATTAHAVVFELAAGRSLADACERAIRDVLTLDTGGTAPIMSLVAMAADGSHAGFSTSQANYVFWEEGMATHGERARVVIE